MFLRIAVLSISYLNKKTFVIYLNWCDASMELAEKAIVVGFLFRNLLHKLVVSFLRILFFGETWPNILAGI